MSLSPDLSKQTNDNIRYGPSSSVDSRFGLQSVVRDDIPGPKTPDTEVNESFHFSPGGSFPIPSTIFYQDAPSPSSELEREPEPEDTPTQLEPAGMVVDTLTCLSNMNIDNNNNNNNNKRKAETSPSTSKKSSIKHSTPTSCKKSSSEV